MADLSLPSVVDRTYLKKSAPELEKSTKLGDSIDGVQDAFKPIASYLKTFDLSKADVDSDPAKAAKDVQKLTEEVNSKLIKPLQLLLSGPVKKLEADASKAIDAAKKAGKETAVRAILTAIKPFRSQAESLIDDTVKDLENLAKGVKKEPAAKGADAGDKKKAELLNKQIQRYSMMAKKAIRELRSGKVKSFPFVFAAHKTKVAYKKGKEWTAKSLLHVHPKAGQSSRNALAKLIDLPSPVFAIGEVRCEDRKKLIFDCTKTPPANIKQLKDALLFQCGFAPALKVMKGAKVEGDEAGEGEDSGEPIEDIPEDDEDDTPTVAAAPVAAKKPSTADAPAGKDADADAATGDDKAAAESEALKEAAKKRFTKRSAEIQKALLAGDRKAKEVKDLAVKVADQIGKSGDGKQAEALMQQLDELLDTPAEVVTAAADVIGAAAQSPELQKAMRDLATLRARAENGVKSLAGKIRDAYVGDAQAPQAETGAKRVEQKVSLLTPVIETQIAELLKLTDPRQRAAKARTVQGIAKSHREKIEGDELLTDVDDSVFHKNLNVIKPYTQMLQRVEGILGGLAG